MPDSSTSNVAQWRTRPVFLTSTFRDMHAERDYLREHVVPELEERLRQRHCHLETIDLRWGVETATVDELHAKELLVLKVCLNEIERSRPFLIALLGDRYGWVPPTERMQAAAQEAGFQNEVAGKSITALEIEFGGLDSADQRRRSHFYFRDPLPYDQMDADTAAQYSELHTRDPQARERHDALQALKARIERQMPDRVHKYTAAWDAQKKEVTGLEAFGQMVLDDLWRDLEAEISPLNQQATVTWQDQERAALEEFVERGSRDFVGRDELVRDLMTFALSPDGVGKPWVVSLTGPAGAGKSAVFCKLHRLLARENVLLLLAHAAGISVRSTSVDSLLFRWIGELAVAVGVAVPVAENDKAEEMETAFRQLLTQAAQQRRVVALLDALNQFEPTVRAKYLTWLSKVFPANVRLITTAIPDTASRALEERPGVQARPLPPLNRSEAELVAEKICARYHRQLHPQVLNELVSKGPASGNPLWLELALEELNLLDQDDFQRAEREYHGSGEEKLRQLLLDTARQLPADIEGLYGWMLQRTEEVWGTEWARAFANLIALSRTGWRESDLQVLLPKAAELLASSQPSDSGLFAWDPLRFAGLRRSFRAHLLQRGALGQWDFYHTQSRLAVERRNLADAAERKRLHALLADHLLGLPEADPLRQSETMFHLIGADDRLRAAAYYATLPDVSAELSEASQTLAAHILAGESQASNPNLGWVLGLLEQPGQLAEQTGDLCGKFMFDLASALGNTARLELRRSLLQATRRVVERLVRHDPSNTMLQRNLSVCHRGIGSILRQQGDLSGAAEEFSVTLAICEELVASDSSNANWQSDLSCGHIGVGDVAMEQGDLDEALRAFQSAKAISQRLAAGDATDADRQSELARSHERVGHVLQEQGNLAGALHAFRTAFAIREQLAASDPSKSCQQDLAVSYVGIGDVLEDQGDLGAGMQAFRAALRIRERLAVADPGNSDWQMRLVLSHQRIANVFMLQGDLGGAIQALRVAEEIAKRLLTLDPNNTTWQADLARNHEKVGYTLRQQGNLTGALQASRSALAIRERLATVDSSNAGWQSDLATSHAETGDVMKMQNDLSEAVKEFRIALEIAKRAAVMNPRGIRALRDVTAYHDRIGSVLQMQGDLGGAQEAFRAALTIRERLVASDQTNAHWQRNLSVSHMLIGRLLLTQGDLAGAEEAFRAALGISERLTTLDPSHALWQCDLAGGEFNVGDVLRLQGKSSAALQAYRKALSIFRKLLEAEWTDAITLSQIAACYDRIGELLQKQEDLEGALDAFRSGIEIGERLITVDASNAVFQRNLSVAQSRIGGLLKQEGHLPGALRAFRAALEIGERLVATDPSNTMWKSDVVSHHIEIGGLLQLQGQLAEALAAFQAALPIAEWLAATDLGNPVSQRQLVVAYYKLGYIFSLLKDSASAVSCLGRCQRQLRAMTNAGITVDPVIEELRQKLEEWEELFASAPSTMVERSRTLTTRELAESAKSAFDRGLWEAADTLYRQLMSKGERLDVAGPRIVVSLLNARPTLSEITRQEIEAFIQQLEAQGQQAVAADLRRQLSEKLAASQPKKSRWQFWK